MSEKYYWLKLKKDFFKRHDIRIIEGLPNGKDYILFYLKLLCESIDHDGNLRFSDKIPYSEEMLATITYTNVDTVKQAVAIFTELGMMEIMDDGTYFMSEVQSMIGSETAWAEKKREYRNQQKLIGTQQPVTAEDDTRTMSGQIFPLSDKSKSKSKSKNIEKESIKKEKTVKRFSPPTLDEVKAYCDERGNHVDAERFVNFYEAKGWMVGKNKMKDWKAAVRTWERDDDKQDHPKGNKFHNFNERQDEDYDALFKSLAN